jgi:hypothetical protein
MIMRIGCRWTKWVILFLLSNRRFGWKCSNGAEPRKDQLIYGSGLGFVLTAVEVMDGYSSDWGASTGDIIANASGTALCVSGAVME